MALLTTIPTLAMGICAPLAAVVGRRFGLRRGALFGLAVIAVATAARVFGDSALAAADLRGGRRGGDRDRADAAARRGQDPLPDRAGLVTGIYTAGLGLGGAVAAGVTAPLADAIGSWPGALASWSVLAVAGIAMWSASATFLGLDSTGDPTSGRDPSDRAGQAGPLTKGLPWRSGVAWRMAALSAANSALYYCELAWVVPPLQDGQRGATGAGCC